MRRISAPDLHRWNIFSYHSPGCNHGTVPDFTASRQYQHITGNPNIIFDFNTAMYRVKIGIVYIVLRCQNVAVAPDDDMIPDFDGRARIR